MSQISMTVTAKLDKLSESATPSLVLALAKNPVYCCGHLVCCTYGFILRIWLASGSHFKACSPRSVPESPEASARNLYILNNI